MKNIVIKYERDNKNKQRKYLYKWYKKVIIIKIKEEKEKSEDEEDKYKNWKIQNDAPFSDGFLIMSLRGWNMSKTISLRSESLFCNR